MKGGLLKRASSKSGKNKNISIAACQAESEGQSSPDNNNEQHFRTLSERIQLSDDEASAGSSGRGGTGSGFSSTSSDEETHKRSSESLASSSGRSSSAATTNQQQGDEMRDLTGTNAPGAASNCVPERPEVVELIDRVRVRFLDSLGGQPDANNDHFEQLDLEELRRSVPSHITGQMHQSRALRLISRFLDFNSLFIDDSPPDESTAEKAVAEATEKLRDFLHFRQQRQLEHVLVDDFCKELYQLHGIFPFGRDKNGLPVLYLRARVHRRWSTPLAQVFERYVAWQVDQITKSNDGAQVARSIPNSPNMKDGSFGICFDNLNVSYACVDMDFLSYLVKILVNYYPTYCRYAVCVDLPWLFRSVWRLVRSWLPEEAQKTVHLITSKQLTEFIDEDQIPNSMKINDLAGSKKSPHGKHRMPVEFETLRSFEQWAQDLNLTSSEIKQFKSHVEKVIKEYGQLGAM